MTMTQRANINVSGGGTKVKYYMSLNVSHDSGLLNTEKAYSWNNNINIMNYTFQNNISYKLTPTTTIRMNMNAQIRQNKGPNINSADLFKMILTTTPVTFLQLILRNRVIRISAMGLIIRVRTIFILILMRG